MFHFDLDDIIHLERLTDSLGAVVPPAISAAAGKTLQSELREEKLPSLVRGKQVTMRRRLTWVLLDGASGVRVEATETRHVCAPAAAVNNTLEITLAPFSRLEQRARLLLLGLLPLSGLVLGLSGWRLLQFDTAMEPLPWGIAGILVGTLCALAIMTFYTPWIAGMLEGPRAVAFPSRLTPLREALRQAIQTQIVAAKAEAEKERHMAQPLPVPTADPVALADYANSLLEDPAGTVLRFGLWRSETQQAIVAAYTDLQADAAKLSAYEKACRPVSAPAAEH